jgi:transcriptional regulator with XRE-family HTH domain
MGGLGNKEIMSKNIKHYMELNNKTRNDMCEALGVKYTTFTDWVNGNVYPRIDKIELMANYFGIEKSDLIEDKSTTEESYYTNKETQQLAQEIFDNPDLKMLFDTTRDCSPEDMKKVISMVKAFKGEL